MQPAASVGNDGNATVRRMKGRHNDGLGPGGTVNDEEFWSKKVQDVPATQVKHPLRLS
jgi:ribosome biogenesis protein MAK21